MVDVDGDNMSFEDCLGPDEAPAVGRGIVKAKRTGKPQDLFEEIKINMVMRIYGVSRERALEIIWGRMEETKVQEDEKGRACHAGNTRSRYRKSSDLMTAEEFFGA